MSILQAAVLAALQGITELFPVSSLAHAVILPPLALADRSEGSGFSSLPRRALFGDRGRPSHLFLESMDRHTACHHRVRRRGCRRRLSAPLAAPGRRHHSAVIIVFLLERFLRS